MIFVKFMFIISSTVMSLYHCFERHMIFSTLITIGNFEVTYNDHQAVQALWSFLFRNDQLYFRLLREKLRLTIVTSLLLVERDTNTISLTQQLNYYGTKSIIFSVWFEFISRARLIYYCLMFFFQGFVLVLNEASWNGVLLEDIYLSVSLLLSYKKGRLAI